MIRLFESSTCFERRSQWPRGLRRRPAAARLLRSWVRIPTGLCKFVCCECCVLSGKGLCDELITRPEKSYRLWCVVVCDLETSRMRRPWPALGHSAIKKTCFEQLRSHPQEDNCMNTTSGITNLKINEWSKITRIHRGCIAATMYSSYFSTFRPLTYFQSGYTRCCIHTIVLLKMST